MATSNLFTLDGVMKAGTDMMGVASTSFQRAMKVQEVTSTKDENQPAFALNELVQACNKDGDEARTIAAALLKKVSSTNPLVRWKALRAIRYICQNCPSTQFKKACGGPNASVIRESTTWTGTPHPRLGNSLNMRVRDAAKETLEEVFKAAPPPTSFQGNGSSVAGVGSSSGGSAAQLKGRIQGYGSTTGGKIQGGVGSSLTGFSGGGSSSSSSGGSKYVGFGSDDVSNGTGHWQKFSALQSVNNGGFGSTYATPTASPSALSSASLEPSTAANTAAARAAIGDEASVVNTLCKGSGGGVNPRATPEATRLFLSQASQLDAEVIALELTHKLFDTTWQERVRALDGMHAIIESVSARGGGHPLEGTVESLSAVVDAFKGVANHENAAVRAAAARVMRVLKVDSQDEASSGTAVSGVGVSAVPADLLGGFDDSGTAGNVASTPAPSPAEPDLFGLRNVSTGAQSGLGGIEDLMGDLSLPATAPQAAVNGTSVYTGASGAPDMFAGLKVASIVSAAAPQIPSQPVVPAEAAAASNGVDLLDFGSAPAQQPAGQATAGLADLFSEWSAPAPAIEVASSVPASTAPVPVGNMSLPFTSPSAPVPPMYAQQANMQPMLQSQGMGMPQPMHAMGMPASGGTAPTMGAMAQGCMRPTQQAFMHTSGELSRVNNRDAFDFVNDAIHK